jgi:hypothetical protein
MRPSQRQTCRHGDRQLGMPELTTF